MFHKLICYRAADHSVGKNNEQCTIGLIAYWRSSIALISVCVTNFA